MDESAADPTAEANRLYWTSDRGVNQIADELGMSKGMLYAAIRPLPAELACPECGAELVYANRTAHERGLLSCASCGNEFDADHSDLEPLAPGATGDRDDAESVRLDLRRARAAQSDTSPNAARTLLGAAALCVGVGVLIGRWLERR